MKVSKVKEGNYIIKLHDQQFTIEKLFGDKYWILWNAKEVEINRSETKSGMLELMRTWTPEYTKAESQQEFCTYA